MTNNWENELSDAHIFSSEERFAEFEENGNPHSGRFFHSKTNQPLSIEEREAFIKKYLGLYPEHNFYSDEKFKSREEAQKNKITVVMDDIAGEGAREINIFSSSSSSPSPSDEEGAEGVFRHINSIKNACFAKSESEFTVSEVTDTEGLLGPLYFSLLITGAARKPDAKKGESQFLYYLYDDPSGRRWLTKEEVGRLSEKDRNNIMIAPNLIQNPNYSGRFYHKGDIWDRGPFGGKSFLLMEALQYERDEYGNVSRGDEKNQPKILPDNKIYLIAGNHETSYNVNGCLGYKRFRAMVRNAALTGALIAGRMEDMNGEAAEQPILIAHTALLANNIGCLLAYLGIAAGACDYLSPNVGSGSAYNPTTPAALFKKISEQKITEDLIVYINSFMAEENISENFKNILIAKLEELKQINSSEDLPKTKLKLIFDVLAFLLCGEIGPNTFKVLLNGKYNVNDIKDFFIGARIGKNKNSSSLFRALQKLKISIGNTILVESVVKNESIELYGGDESDDCLMQRIGERGIVNCIFWSDVKLFVVRIVSDMMMPPNSKPKKIPLSDADEIVGRNSVGHQNGNGCPCVVKDDSDKIIALDSDICARDWSSSCIANRKGENASVIIITVLFKNPSNIIPLPIIMKIEPSQIVETHRRAIIFDENREEETHAKDKEEEDAFASFFKDEDDYDDIIFTKKDDNSVSPEDKLSSCAEDFKEEKNANSIHINGN
ncbi:MAG: hypothetical protein LBB09_00465 [Rickettsiales bacterium]|jgi:hypothetical protein|nr:hypothetical protein [Rickettsiales bacterium]